MLDLGTAIGYGDDFWNGDIDAAMDDLGNAYKKAAAEFSKS